MKLLRVFVLFVLITGGMCPTYGEPPAAIGLRFALNEVRRAAWQAPIVGIISTKAISRSVSVSLFEMGKSRITTGTLGNPVVYRTSTLPVTPPSFPLPSYMLLSKQKTDAFIFDLDGTLLNSLGAWENAASNYLKTRGINLPPNLQAAVEQMSLMDGAHLLKERYQLEESPEELVAATIRPVGERYYNDIPAKTYVPQLLSYLQSQGIKMAVATASHADFARGALERLGLLDYFEFIITCDEVGVGKTSPLVYEEAQRRLGVEKTRTVVVEDAPYALQTARTAGFKTIGVAEEHYRKELPQLKKVADLFLDFDK